MNQNGYIEQPGKVMRIGIAYVDGKRIAPMTLQDRPKTTFNLSKCIIPTHCLPHITSTYHWLSNTIRVSIQFFEAICLWADIAVAEDILGITPDRDHLAPSRNNL